MEQKRRALDEDEREVKSPFSDLKIKSDAFLTQLVTKRPEKEDGELQRPRPRLSCVQEKAVI